MSDPRDLTELELAVLRMLAKPSKIQIADIQADFVVRAVTDPTDIIQAVFGCVDWDKITLHMEEGA